MNRIHQIQKIYEPEMTEYDTNLHYSIKKDSLIGGQIEFIGLYTEEYIEQRGYDMGERKAVIISPKILEEDRVIFDFDGSRDMPIGDKVEINGEECVVARKKYQLNGVIDYYVQDKFIKSEDYEEQYKKIKNETKDYLFDKLGLKDKYQKQNTKTVINKKKSVWWHFGIR